MRSPAAWYVAVNQLSTNILSDSVTAVGFVIAFYYGLAGLACVVYYRKALLRSVKNFLLVGVLPLLGAVSLAAVVYYAYNDYQNKGYAEGYNSSKPLLGIEIPILIGIGGLLCGVVAMFVAQAKLGGAFFHRRPEAADADALERPPATTAVAME